ncbi:MAG: EamA family transporter [Candidatus Gracilibacteria bacterium]|nr:EamA family transporter [Candidatus Gracilibacteria bacterium]
MNEWFIYGIISIISTGFFSFSSKISVEKNHNPNLVTFYSSLIAAICSILYFIYSDGVIKNFYLEIILGITNGLFYLVTVLTRIKSLKYIDTGVYFPIYKALGPILLLIISILYLSEKFTTIQSLGILLGICVPFLLITKKSKSKNIKKGLIYLFVGLLAAIISGLSVKYASIYKVNILLVVVYSLFFQTIGAYYLLKKHSRTDQNFSFDKIKSVGIVTGLLNFIGFYSFTSAVNLSGSIGLIYVMQSLYIIIPIILSVIMYKEHFDFKKFIAILLTITSIYFMK